ncbi:hypothetical protein [Mucilaginibacter ginsenosidivorax]|uniref:DUF5689 domain-containing protein n=1 Tax=Mucilaginibacter ginsenosidivorax TaxID=862126 RepID=A0A5B8W640_9SPHI|nr:hypothetical protein [Mucilaginibacter ginsenosidivorax]QEC79334.1 hypothetical protein FSB76_26545 [Mucilaginibacter ginsenosidivorax]
MKKLIMIIGLAIASLLYSCGGKGNNPAPPIVGPVVDPNAPVNKGNETSYNGYVVKTIGISRARVSLDDNNKIIVADLYGGGNRVVLTSGTTNTVEMGVTSLYAATRASYPELRVGCVHVPIDNGSVIDTAGSGTVFKIKGFDKSKTGYNQLNVVFCDEVFANEVGNAGYYQNYTYVKMNKAAGKTNDDYGADFIKKLYSGKIGVKLVEMAKPLSEHPYLTRDDNIAYGISTYNIGQDRILGMDFTGNYFRAEFMPDDNGYANHIGTNVKLEWVNIDKGTIIKDADATYHISLPNIKSGDVDQFAYPSDTVNKAFLRISGLDPKVCGYNQYRLFLTADNYNNGTLRLYYNRGTIKAEPTIEFYKQQTAKANLYNGVLRPLWSN